MVITKLIRDFQSIREALESHGIRDTGGYAELLVAKALGATRNISGVQKGFDITCQDRGKVEVRSRTLPRNGRNEDRIEIPEQKANGFDWLAGVLFGPDMTVIGGFLLPHDDAIELANRQRYKRISFRMAASHSSAVDITQALRDAQSSV